VIRAITAPPIPTLPRCSPRGFEVKSTPSGLSAGVQFAQTTAAGSSWAWHVETARLLAKIPSKRSAGKLPARGKSCSQTSQPLCWACHGGERRGSPRGPDRAGGRGARNAARSRPRARSRNRVCATAAHTRMWPQQRLDVLRHIVGRACLPRSRRARARCNARASSR